MIKKKNHAIYAESMVLLYLCAFQPKIATKHLIDWLENRRNSTTNFGYPKAHKDLNFFKNRQDKKWMPML